MAEMTFGAKGKRWSALARLIAESDPSIQVVETKRPSRLESVHHGHQADGGKSPVP